MKTFILSFAVAIIATGAFLYWFKRVPQTKEIKKVKVGSVEYSVELALSNEQKAKGLSGHAPLAKNQGMLFLFGDGSKPTFHMQGMNFPIDIVWISNGKVVGVETNAQPWQGITGKFYSPPEPISHVLEINANSGIEVGDNVAFR